MSNPLLNMIDFPDFKNVQPDHMLPAIKQIIADSRQEINKLVETAAVSWQGLALPLDELDDRLSQVWSVISHLNAVVNSDAIRDAYNGCLAELTEFSTWTGQHQGLYQAWKALSDSAEFANLDQQRKQTIAHCLRDFRLSGVHLPDAEKKQYAALSKRLSELQSKFSENVLDATQGWTKLIEDKALLVGLPESALAGAEQAATKKEQKGYLLSLNFPCYYAVMTYCDSAALRQEIYEAFQTRASEVGPNAGKWDNTGLIKEILELRHEQSQLLGFENFAQRSLAKKMAESTEQVLTFLHELAEKSLPVAKAELEDLKQFALEQDNISTIDAWDLGYYSEKLRQHRYDLSQETLRPWFPADKVVTGLFDTAKQLFDVDIQEDENPNTWHTEVRRFRIFKKGEEIAAFYMDLFARENKRGGAWMSDVRVRRCRQDGSLQTPVAFITCNFTPAVAPKPALLTHNEVVTLFHEFGHGLHHMLTQMDVNSVSGINGVPWDAVELPSQFLENWCWQPQSIALISSHYETGEALPKEMLEKMLAAKNFQSGMGMLRQLEFALFDFRLHAEYDASNPLDVQTLIREVRDQVAVTQPPEYNRFSHSFSHIFAGGYAAGYYSYKWAEVLAADAFSLFEERGVFDKATGEHFRTHILEKGGSDSPLNLFKAFRGREPCVDALLRHSGIQD